MHVILAAAVSRNPRLGRTFLISAAAVLFVLSLPGRINAAGGTRAFFCSALVAWGQSINPRRAYHVAPRLAVPKAFQEPDFSATFGAPALELSPEDLKAVRHTIDHCYQQARNTRDGSPARGQCQAPAARACVIDV